MTGVEGDVTTILLPAVGDQVLHRAADGRDISGRVQERCFQYELADGRRVSGNITVTLMLTRDVVH